MGGLVRARGKVVKDPVKDVVRGGKVIKSAGNRSVRQGVKGFGVVKGKNVNVRVGFK